VVTPLNRNRWNLNMEATLAFQQQHRVALRIFISDRKWKDGQPTEEEALMMLNHGDDSAIPVPAVFMFVPGMPIVVNNNTHQGLKLVKGASYTALDVIVDKAFPGYHIQSPLRQTHLDQLAFHSPTRRPHASQSHDRERSDTKGDSMSRVILDQG
jgi:hypothetical protein